MQSAGEDSYDQTIGMPEQPGTCHFLSIGEVVDGAYKVLEFIGAGAFGEVYLVRHEVLHRNFALKLLRSSGLDDAIRSRFIQEVQVMAKLEHPNIVKIYNSGVYKGNFPYYIMDLIVGKSLADLIASRGRIDVLSAVTIFVAVADALKVSHGRNIVHRDIKPANIIIADGGGPLDTRVRVVDFGVAKLLGRNSPAYQALTTVGQVFGSPLYMSPEQCTAASIDNRSDIYSLGCALYEALTGVVPFRGATVMDTFQMHCSQAVPTLKQKAPALEFASELEEIIQQLMAKSPEDRFQNMTQVKTSLLLVGDLLQKNSNDTASSIEYSGRRVVWGGLSLLVTGICVAGLVIGLANIKTDKVASQVMSDTPKNERVDVPPKTNLIDQDSNLQNSEFYKPVPSDQYFKGLGKDGAAEYFLPGGGGQFIGKLCSETNQRVFSTPAFGAISRAKNTQWTFCPGPIVGKNPSILLGFRRQDIVGIDLDSLPQADRAKVLRAACERFPGLYSIVLCHQKVDSEILNAINQAKNLDMLSINAQGLSKDEIFGLRRLNAMKQFEIANYSDDLSLLLERLVSPNLNVLSLKNVQMKEADLVSLERAKNLERISLEQVGMRREWLRHLLMLKKLSCLDLVNDHQNCDWVGPLTPFWRLKELVVRDDTATDSERERLHGMLRAALLDKRRTLNCNIRFNRNSDIYNFSKYDDEAAAVGTMLFP